MKLYVAKDKDGTVHLSNSKLMKPSEWYKDNPNANDEIFFIPFELIDPSTFFVMIDANIIEGLTFENSPKEVVLTIKEETKIVKL